MIKIAIFWFRRDLRLYDNVGLHYALKENKQVLPIFIFDTQILKKLPKDDARVNFIHNQLTKIDCLLKTINAGLSLYLGKPLEIFQTILSQYNVVAVYANHDYEPYARERDLQINNFLTSKNIAFYTFKDQVIFEKHEITKTDGNPYIVYTPYAKKWLDTYQNPERTDSENNLQNCIKNVQFPFLNLKDIGFEPPNTFVPDYTLNPKLIEKYEETRNFPALDQTSHLGPHLRFGTVSVRDVVHRARQEDNLTFLKELIWREFFMQILWHFPHTQKNSFKPKYDRIPWRNHKKEFERWCKGKTGFPLVDAGMRQLNHTGFMHNRVRMLTSSFLCKHLLIDWRWGEAYFAKKLYDYDMASNVGNWQWAAGTGVDAAPYFRIFNPTSQVQKFDTQLQYIKKWVPDFQELTYPAPMVDHKLARNRCLETYKKALQ